MLYAHKIATTLNISTAKVENTIKLLEEGATIPFISRYRKEATGSLDEVQIAEISNELKKLQELTKRKETILKTIEEQGKQVILTGVFTMILLVLVCAFFFIKIYI